MLRKKSFYACIFIINLAALSYSASLSGVIRDSTQTPITGVKIILTGLSVTGFVDSATTGPGGLYSFDNLSIGTYSLSLTDSGFIKKDTAIVAGNSSILCNFVLAHEINLPNIHYGIVRGTWLPKDNPHIITDTAYVKDSLFIAPGCSVLINKPLIVHGKLSIGAQSGNMTILKNGPLYCQDSNANISIIRTICNFLLFDHGINLCRNLSLDSVSSPVLSNAKVTAVDSLKISRMVITGPYESKGVIDEFPLEGSYVKISKSIFSQIKMTVSFDFEGFFTNDIFDFVSFSRLNPTQTQYRIFISHSNFNNINLFAYSNNDTIINSIIISGGIATISDQVYPFSFNIIGYSVPQNIFGLLQNVRTNVNGDSCDLWFNLKTDPRFADNTLTVLQSNSPAIKAASDGTNIGYYQGGGVSIVPSPIKQAKNIVKNAIRPVSGIRNVLYSNFYINNKDATLFIYNSSGRCLVNRHGITGKQLIALPFNLIPGTFIYSLDNVKTKITGRFIIP